MKTKLVLTITILLISKLLFSQPSAVKFHTLDFDFYSGIYNDNGITLENKYSEIIAVYIFTN